MQEYVSHRLAVFSIAGCFLLAAGCKEPQAQARQTNAHVSPSSLSCSESLEKYPRQVVLFILDRSLSLRRGTRDQWDEIRAEASRLLRRVAPATRVFVRFISGQSYPDEEQVLSAVIPEESLPLQCPPFDPRCLMAEQRRKALLHCVDDARERLAVAVENLTPVRANHTDVWGAVAAASDVLSAYPQSQRVIVIYSDLIDTVGTTLPSQLPGLAQTQVIVRLVKNGNPKEVAQRLSTFSERLATWGAAVQTLQPDGPIDSAIFIQPSITGSLLTTAK